MVKERRSNKSLFSRVGRAFKITRNCIIALPRKPVNALYVKGNKAIFLLVEIRGALVWNNWNNSSCDKQGRLPLSDISISRKRKEKIETKLFEIRSKEIIEEKKKKNIYFVPVPNKRFHEQEPKAKIKKSLLA
ncbi:MAG: hypothetical protein WC688_07200 [Parachlamydiales bacterium]